MKLFNTIDIETSSACNRTCRTCLRNSYPDRKAVRPLFTQTLMPVDMFRGILDECVELDYKDRVCMCHWNEPLMDPQIVELAKIAKGYNQFFVYFVTNGDLLTPELAAQLDGVLDKIVVSVYDGDRQARKAWLRSVFTKTPVEVKGDHRIAHFHPQAPEMAQKLLSRPCRPIPRRLIVNHKGEYLLCCEDLLGTFGLGRFPEMSLKEYWFGGKHERILDDLSRTDGRLKYQYCSSCPMEFVSPRRGRVR
jgi:MoaA/NifB/PqqE/SkfB family radical SAM enzyme